MIQTYTLVLKLEQCFNLFQVILLQLPHLSSMLNNATCSFLVFISFPSHPLLHAELNLKENPPQRTKNLPLLTTHLSMPPCSSSASPESGLGTSHTSLPGSGQGSTNDQPINDEMYYEADALQPLGTCKALYPFDGELVTCFEGICGF